MKLEKFHAVIKSTSLSVREKIEKEMDLRILYLTLKSKWYDMIADGIKKEEYRDETYYWMVRLMNWEYRERNNVAPFKEFTDFKHFDIVRFARGGHFHPSIPQMNLEFKGTELKEGNPEWGAVPGKIYFTINLGEITTP